MPLHWPAKTPSQNAPYTIDWSTDMDAGDTIATYTPTIPAGASIVLGTHSVTGQKSQVWISGGLVGTYTISNVITTTLGETFTQDAELWVRPE